MAVRGRVASDGSWVTIDPDRLAAFIADGGGPVVKDMMRRATNVQNVAKQRVGKRTRRLERSIVKRAGVDAAGPFVLVVTEAGWLRRLALRRGYDDAALEEWMARQDPRATEDRRQAERRTDRTPEEQERILQQLGQQDRRRADRRKSGSDRRR
jgi:hypothetical protein